MVAYLLYFGRTGLLHQIQMTIALSSFELMHQMRGGHMGLGSEPIVRGSHIVHVHSEPSNFYLKK